MDDLLGVMEQAANDGPSEVYADIAAGVIIVDAQGRIVSVNAFARKIFPVSALVGSTPRSVFTTRGLADAERLIQAAEAGRESEPVRVNLPDGRTFEGRTRPLADGHTLISLFEITAYVQNTEVMMRDTLTGLVTRAGFNRQLEQQLGAMHGSGGQVAVIYVDLDKFKLVNDTLGHLVGDALLVKVAERLRSATRADDVVARLGGDEFGILQAAQSQPEAAEALARRLVDLIGRTYIAAGHMVTVGASVGVAIAPTDGDDPITLQKHADLALYRAKADGRGVFRFFQPSMDAEMQARRLLEMDLRKALALKEFELFYQPQLNLETNRLVGFEALLRWRSPARGLVSPAVFIPLAEEIGLISRIGEWVLQTACREAASWPLPVSVSVNVSPMQFRNGKLVQMVTSALAQSGLDPARLELEITESSLLDDTENVLEALKKLKSIGVGISMDDFGTGYSSLNYLSKFPFDKIKIDQSFVRNMETRPQSVAIVRAVAALSASLGMTTIAEGVETQEQLASVRAEGCHAVQGYLTGRPLPAADAAALMTEPTSSR